MSAAQFKLSNVVVFADANKCMIDGRVDDEMKVEPLDKKFEAFNFHVINCSAHDFDELRAAFKEARETKGMPTCIVVHSVKGKGVSFMENKAGWHHHVPTQEEYNQIMADFAARKEAALRE